MEGKKFIIYPIQQLTPCCDKKNIDKSLDGNREQFCTNCNWKWNANKDKQIVF